MNLSELKKPFAPERVSWRVGSTNADKSRGLALAYIDARDVQDRLDEVCEPHNWQCRYALLGTTTICEIGIRIGDEWVWKADGAGATDVEGEKGALSDALKRAAVKWGIGRYLYDLDSPWVELEAAGRSYKIKPSEMKKLHALLNGSHSPKSEVGEANGSALPHSSFAEDRVHKARKWAQMATVTLKGIKTGADFDKWHLPNRDTIARLREIDPKIHTDLLAEIDCTLDRINPVGA